MPVVIVITLSGEKSPRALRYRKEFRDRGIDTIFCHPHKFGIVVEDGKQYLTYDGKLIVRPDFVVTLTGKGAYTPGIIRAMQDSGWDVENRSEPILSAVDKARTMIALANAQLPIPKTWVITAHHKIPEGVQKCSVLKLPTGSCGDGVMIFDDLNSLKAALGLLKASNTDIERKPVLLQEYLDDRPGIDLRCIVVGNRALGVMQRVAQNGEKRGNMAQGAKAFSVELTPEIASMSERAYAAIGLAWGGVDLCYKRNGFAVIEINSSPGLKFESVCKVNVIGAIADLVDARIKEKYEG